jgi:GNAT superfamily N-acetyltransferase
VTADPSDSRSDAPSAFHLDFHSAFHIEELPIPASMEADGAAAFAAAIDVHYGSEAASYGTGELAFTAREALPRYLDPQHEPTRLFVARVGEQSADRIVGVARYEWEPGADGTTAWLMVDVLAPFRRRGIGSALAEHIEGLAAAAGIVKLIVYAVSPASSGAASSSAAPSGAASSSAAPSGAASSSAAPSGAASSSAAPSGAASSSAAPSGAASSSAAPSSAPRDRLASPTGFGSVPAGNPEVRFLLGRGYRLEQVVRGSRLALPVDVGPLLAETSARAGAEYALHCWVGDTPERWRTDLAMLCTRMSTEEPTAGLEEPEDLWDVARLVADEERRSSTGRVDLVAAIEHLPSASLVAFTRLSAPADRARSVSQEDTLVLPEHRGHRLGMLLKVANLDQLQRERPGHPSVITFNAEENVHMLAVNEAVGFTPIGYEGAWRRDLA